MLAQYVRIDDLHIRGALQKKKKTQPDDPRPVIAHLCLHAVKTNSVVDVKYLQNIRKVFQLTDPARHAKLSQTLICACSFPLLLETL